jgi:hypothetical protein
VNDGNVSGEAASKLISTDLAAISHRGGKFMRRNLGIFAACGILVLSALPAAAQNVEKAPPGAPYKKVSELVKLPDFLPGMGTLYVDPKTLPEGPFSPTTTKAIL